jgi:argininosuccinate synthase
MRIDQLTGVRVGVCQSGGLSALATAVWLHERGVPAHNYVADLGQCGADRLEALVGSMQRHGMSASVVDLRDAMAETAADLLRYRARHDGGYWNTTSVSRLVLVRELAPRMRDDGCEVLVHGCVGGGNDQRRFTRYTQILVPDLGVYPPWTDPAALDRFGDREAMLDAIAHYELALDEGSGADQSTDANLAGASHELGELEDLRTPPTVIAPRWSVWPADAPEQPETVTVTFDRGQVIDVDGSGQVPLRWLGRAHEVGARNGVWLRDVLEGRIIGTLCRGVYEAPALELLDRAWRRVLQVSLDKEGGRLFERLSAELGQAVYEARYLDPSARAIRAALDVLVAQSSATVTLSVHRGSVVVTGIEVPNGVPSQQRRFAGGGHRWAEPVAVSAVAQAGLAT